MNDNTNESQELLELQREKLRAEIKYLNKQSKGRYYKFITAMGSILASIIVVIILYYGYFTDIQKKHRENELFKIEQESNRLQQTLNQIQRKKDSLNLIIKQQDSILQNKDSAIVFLSSNIDSLNKRSEETKKRLDFVEIEIELKKLRQIANFETDIETLNFLISEAKKGNINSKTLEDSLRHNFVGNDNYKLNLFGSLILTLSNSGQYKKSSLIREINNTFSSFQYSEKELDEELFRILLLYHSSWTDSDYLTMLTFIDTLTRHEFSNSKNQIYILKVVSDIYYMNPNLIEGNIDLFLNILSTELNIIRSGKFDSSLDPRRMLVNLSPQAYASLFLKQLYSSLLFQENFYKFSNKEDSIYQSLRYNYYNSMKDSYFAIELGSFVGWKDTISVVGKLINKYYVNNRYETKKLIESDMEKIDLWLEDDHTYFREHPKELMHAIEHKELK